MIATSAAGSLPHVEASRSTRDARALVVWLSVCALLIFAMVVVGGVTRLTHSGLSITEWQPIVGTIPPVSEADWNEAFAKYRATPEFLKVNHAMTLGEFKGIFWWEYFHRLLGRAIGVVFLVPYLYFLARRRIPQSLAWPLAGVFALGALQGLVGWLMVQSGLVDDPRVSQFRLTAHLGLAVAIFGAIVWIALSLAYPRRPVKATLRPLRAFAFALVGTVFVMILSGGLVAGIRAGFAYNTFPLMHGYVVPPEILMLDPWWRNFFWNMATVQFDHRLIAWLLAVLVPLFWWKARRPDVPQCVRAGSTALLAMLALQVTLGITTLLLVVPLPLAALHQAGAVVVFALAVNVAHGLTERYGAAIA
jgi:cytochrome c oxidase assembly protein subunit 15